MKLRIHHITWNVASTYPLKDELYNELFCVDNRFNYKFGEFPDIFVISLQEQSLNLMSIIENQWESKFKEFFKEIRSSKNLFYIKLKASSILFTYQYVFVKHNHLRAYTGLQTQYYSNFGGVSGKGTIAFKFLLDKTSFIFLSAHLDAHDYGNEERINHYKRVLANDTFYDFIRILTSSYAFYAGDLNFRLVNLETHKLINDINEKGQNEEYLQQLLQNNDQLKTAQQKKEAFEDFHEEKITFKPTFKFHQDTKEYNPKRAPSWCDRVLYRGKVLKSIQCIYYNSIEKYLQSDHRPVVGLFDLETDIRLEPPKSNVRVLSTNKTQVDNKLDVWLNKSIEPKDFAENIFLKTVSMASSRASHKQDLPDSEEKSEIRKGWDWIGLFKEDFDDLDDYLAYLYVEHVPSNQGPPEEILRKMCNIEKTEKETKAESPMANIGSASSSSFLQDDAYFNDLKKKLEWTRVEFPEQTFAQTGRYVLIYFNGDRSVEFISEPIEIVAD